MKERERNWMDRKRKGSSDCGSAREGKRSKNKRIGLIERERREKEGIGRG
jgi:hypothetical protein